LTTAAYDCAYFWHVNPFDILALTLGEFIELAGETERIIEAMENG
jgi:hypothetical protein